jgi:hypothetical protein
MEPVRGEAELSKIQELEQQLQQSHAKLQKAENAKKKLREHVVRAATAHSRCLLFCMLLLAGSTKLLLLLLPDCCCCCPLTVHHLVHC